MIFETENFLPFLDRVVQWVVIPMCVLLWTHNRKHFEHEKKFIEQQGEIKAVLAVLESWKAQRTEDQQTNNKTFERLTAAVEKLNDRLERMSHHSVGGK
jgi:hypothetical protein